MPKRKPVKHRAYGIMARAFGPNTEWMWVTPGMGVTRVTADGASFHGEGGNAAAYEAAKFLSRKMPGVTFKVVRKPHA